ncbi:T9SS type A sorting domain-containing protein [Flavobacterium sp. XS2P14]|uniref:T9SS type A sorting domain-containing protein n=1 Tax=Flavobacterium sp. XS2P14 TaxID=3401735 RepID=UPI003AAFAE11
MKKITFILLFCLFFSAHNSFAQVNNTTEVSLFGKNKVIKTGEVIRCASTEYEEYLKSKNPNRLSNSEFEQWITPKIALEKEIRKNAPKGSRVNAVITIPVVVHVIHNGDLIGTDENIFDEQVISQIQVLNEDFRRKSATPGFNTNPVGADVEIEFALAKRDPSGVLTNGIDRVDLEQASWSTDDIDTMVKPLTVWNPDKYLNIWVVKFSAGSLLGYAQFPSNSTLTGINVNGGPASTDGVVIGYSFFGSSAYFPSGTYAVRYDGGRTTTHEVGHWLGLRHIWGDGDCTVDDFCADTPNAGQENYGCPKGADSCIDSPGLDMIENYMDYTNDTCMNIFTTDQKNRMITVMNNSARRASLKTSDALTPGILLTNDATTLVINLNINCSKTFLPRIKITNKGTAPLKQASIRYGVDNQNLQTYNWTGTLANNQSQNVTLSSITSATGVHNFNATILSTNGTTDQNTANNSSNIDFELLNTVNYTSNTVNFSLQQDYYGKEITWELKNTAGVVLYKGGPFTNTTRTEPLPALITETFNLSSNDCYTFSIYDSGGDGICCDYGAGSYSLQTPSGDIIVSGGNFTGSETTKFSNNSLATNEFESESSVYLYPNPTSNLLQIAVENKLDIPENYTIINTLGQIIKAKKIDSEADLSINVSNLTQGIYFLKLSKNQSETKTIRFIKK